MRTRHLPTLLLAAVTLLASQPAAAQTQVRREPSAAELALAKDMLKEAASEVKGGKCDDAVAILKQVMAIKEIAEAMFLLAECQAKKDPAEALETYRRAEELARQQKDKATQQAAAAKITELSASMPTLIIEVPEGVSATVTLDGKEVPPDQLGQPITVAPGEHTIEATAEGRPPFSKKIDASPKRETVVKVELGAEPSSGGAGGGPSDGGQPDKSTPEIPLATWIAGSAALVLTAGGVIAFVAAGSAASDGEAECAKLLECDPDAVDSVRQLDAAALGLWIGAAVGAGVAVTFYVLETGKTKASLTAGPSRRGAAPRMGQRQPPPLVSRVSLGPGSLTLAGSF